MSTFVLTAIAALPRSWKSRQGQSLVEYALVLSFISLLSIAVMSVMGAQIRGLYTPIINAMEAVRLAISG